MTGEEWALAASIFFSGLAAGFLGGLCTVLRPMQAAMSGQEFRGFMETFLRYAGNGQGRAYNLAWSLGMFLGPLVALVLLWDDPGSTSFVLTAIGLVIVFLGVIVVSNAWKTPTYAKIVAHDAETLPADWRAVRQQYFTINWLQLATTWTAFALFLVALAYL
jgi:MFS family permease